MKRKAEDADLPDSPAASLKVQIPDQLTAVCEAPDDTLDFSLIDPVLLGPALLDPVLRKDETSTSL